MEVITRDMTIEEVLEKLGALKKVSKRFNAERYCGTVKFEEDGLQIQKRLRSEWK